MFLQITDLKNSIYNYQIDQITEEDDSITIQAMMTAEQEVRSYLAQNNKREWDDGRLNYDLDAIFGASGTNRNPLILAHTTTIAKWYIVELCNADIIYEIAKERYDRAISWLKGLAKGDYNLDTLPTIQINEEDENNELTDPFTYGSRKKFEHE